MSTDSKPTNDRKLEWLEAMRGFAAIWVLLHHANQSISHFLGEPGVTLIASGHLGVDFFFVLSGFIIAFSSDRLAAKGGGVREYLRARLIRIYVPYLPIGIGIFFLYLLLPGLSAGERTPSILSSFALLPTNSPPALSVAWTLIHEMIFYVFCSTFFVSRRAFWGLMVAWAMMIIGIASVGIELPLSARYFLSPMNLCFLLGLGVFQLRRWPMPAWLALTTAVLGCAFVASQAAQLNPNRIIVGLGFALMVAAAASPHAWRLRVPRPLITLGAASYAIYLVHSPVIALTSRIVQRTCPDVGYITSITMLAAVSLLAGIGYWWAYEKKALAWTRRTLTRASSSSA